MKKRIVKGLLMFSLSGLMLTACFSENAVETEEDGTIILSGSSEKEETEEATEETVVDTSNGKSVTPVDSGIDMNNLTNATVAASFQAKDINLDTMEITFTVYTKDEYEASDISMLQIGDTILYNGREMTVELIEDRSGELYINGGYEEGGCNLTLNEENRYVAKLPDDYPTYTSHGGITLPIAESLVLSDSINDPSKPAIAGFDDLSDYKDTLEEWSSDYTQLNTTVQITNSKVTAITRIWTP